jgi:hypothetical protein
MWRHRACVISLQRNLAACAPTNAAAAIDNTTGGFDSHFLQVQGAAACVRTNRPGARRARARASAQSEGSSVSVSVWVWGLG